MLVALLLRSRREVRRAGLTDDVLAYDPMAPHIHKVRVMLVGWVMAVPIRQRDEVGRQERGVGAEQARCCSGNPTASLSAGYLLSPTGLGAETGETSAAIT